MGGARRIDWARPCYRKVTSRAGERTAGALCDICRGKVRQGERIIRGPRGMRVAHLSCVPYSAEDAAGPLPPPEGELEVIGSFPPHVMRQLDLEPLADGEGLAIVRAGVADLRRMPVLRRVAVVDPTAASPRTAPVTLVALAELHKRIDTLTRERFVAVLLPHYRNDRHYVEGLWPQFCQGPIPFMLSRKPIEPGAALLAFLQPTP